MVRTTKTTTTGKAPAAKKTTVTAKKTVATKKPEAVAAKKSTSAVKAVKVRISEDERMRMIAENAYFRAERRGFVGGSTELDWLEAEKEVNSLLS